MYYRVDDMYKMLEEDRVLAERTHDEIETHLTSPHSTHQSRSSVNGSRMSAATVPGVEPQRPTDLLYAENSQVDRTTIKMEVCLIIIIIIFKFRI